MYCAVLLLKFYYVLLSNSLHLALAHAHNTSLLLLAPIKSFCTLQYKWMHIIYVCFLLWCLCWCFCWCCLWNSQSVAFLLGRIRWKRVSEQTSKRDAFDDSCARAMDSMNCMFIYIIHTRTHLVNTRCCVVVWVRVWASMHVCLCVWLYSSQWFMQWDGALPIVILPERETGRARYKYTILKFNDLLVRTKKIYKICYNKLKYYEEKRKIFREMPCNC